MGGAAGLRDGDVPGGALVDVHGQGAGELAAVSRHALGARGSASAVLGAGPCRHPGPRHPGAAPREPEVQGRGVEAGGGVVGGHAGLPVLPHPDELLLMEVHT